MSLKQKDKHTNALSILNQGTPSSPGTPFLIFSGFIHGKKIVAAAEMKVRRLKMRRHVWTHILLWAPAGSVHGRRVMYYLELVLPRCLIRAWLREAVTGCFSASAQEWRRSHDQHRSGSILAYIQCKTLELHQTVPSRGLVASLGYLGDISLMHSLTGHAAVQSLCC